MSYYNEMHSLGSLLQTMLFMHHMWNQSFKNYYLLPAQESQIGEHSFFFQFCEICNLQIFQKSRKCVKFTLEPYFLKSSQAFYKKIHKICGTKVMPIMNRVWIFNYGITRNLVNFSKNQEISQIYTRKPKISKNFPTFIMKKCKNLLEKTHWNHEPVKRLGTSTKCKVISVPSLKFSMKPRLTYKQQDALFKITFHPVERIFNYEMNSTNSPDFIFKSLNMASFLQQVAEGRQKYRGIHNFFPSITRFIAIFG